jgi:hypothetical protein
MITQYTILVLLAERITRAWLCHCFGLHPEFFAAKYATSLLHTLKCSDTFLTHLFEDQLRPTSVSTRKSRNIYMYSSKLESQVLLVYIFIYIGY